ncbi:MAG TPA: hypothetical protein VGB56_13660, partial [Flavisolibacter sp.]
LPRSLLLAGRGIRREGLNFYSWGGFITMQPFDFYSDRYVSLFYKHDLDKNFWNAKWSKPYLSVAHNLIYGSLQQGSLFSNTGLKLPGGGYHESGLILNRVLRYNFGFADLNGNAGVFYHWANKGRWKDNAVWVFSLSMGV